jgi:excinuclease UvrABC helicase subunit UvrB
MGGCFLMAKKNNEITELKEEIESLKIQLEKASTVILDAYAVICPGQTFVNYDSLLIGAKKAVKHQNEYETTQLAIQNIERAKMIRSKQIADVYDMGMCNGIELSLSFLQNRPPEYKDRADIQK